ncbi:MAG: HD domain-containing protein [Candidatus Cloacimonetes bacterium]|jgi:HD superfamily phosphohydrolase|nr:HD domain-containing protein [Candidatus Cloacimonadota bacterium]
MTASVTIRDPLWDTIRVDPIAMQIVDAPAFQRLRHIRQLGLAYLVYPGATHTRFDHALGVYHLAHRALSALRTRGALDAVDETDSALIPFAGLLHDIGHYPFSHALEELQADRIPGHHEALVGRFLSDDDVTTALAQVTPDAAERVEALIRGTSDSPLQGLVSGSLDLDKIEYLMRDATFAGVPYGRVDVDRLLHGLTLLRDEATGRLEVGVHEKGVAALESLLFAKYQMFRNVYWHHAVRAATVMYKRIVNDALDASLLVPDELVGQTDEGVLYLIAARAERDDAQARSVAARVEALRMRRLPKRAAEVVAAELDEAAIGDWIETDTPLKREVEERIAQELALAPGDAFLDYPEKSKMFGLDLLVQRRSGEVIRLGPEGRAGLIGLPEIADELYRTARVLRLFTLNGRRVVDPAALARLAQHSNEAMIERLESDEPLLG